MVSFTEEDKQDVLQTIKKRRRIYSLCYFASLALVIVFGLLAAKVQFLFIVPALIFELLAVIMASFVVWCINNYRSVLYDGETGGGGFVWFLWLLFGGIIIPIIIVAILRNCNLGYKVLGCVKIDD